MEKIALITKADKLLMIRWINLFVGFLQLHYFVAGAGPITGLIACINIGVWTFTRQMQAK
jgi:hypothetical protein